MTITFETVQEQIGRTLPGGSFSVEPYQDWLMRDVSLSTTSFAGPLHPLWAFAGTQGAMGVSIEELFAIVHASSEDGPMLGESDIEILRPLGIGETFTVSATITDIVRKSGKRAGTFDIVTVAMSAEDSAGTTVALLTNSYVFPRRDA